MLWFKHPNNYRSTVAMQFIVNELGEVGYARALRLLEIFCQVSTRKPFDPRIEIKPPCTWHWLALEMGCPTEEEAVRTIEVFGKALFIQIPEKVILQERTKRKDAITRPSVITCDGLKEMAEWHNLSNRNKKRLEKEDAPMPENGLFVAAASAPGDDAARQPQMITRLKYQKSDSEQIQKQTQN